MSKSMVKILSLTLALLMLAGCASTPATVPADPLEGTMTVEPFDAEKLAADMGNSDDSLIGTMLELDFFGNETKMFDYAIFGVVVESETVTPQPPVRDNEFLPKDKVYIRYKIKIEEVIGDKSGKLKEGEVITLYHPYQTKYDRTVEKFLPYFLKVGSTYALTFMDTLTYEFYYDQYTLPAKDARYKEYQGDKTKTIWRLPLKDIGDYFVRGLTFRAMEVVEGKITLRFPITIADRYLDNTKYESQMDGHIRGYEYSYVVDKDFFKTFYQAACRDIDVWLAGTNFEMMYLQKYDPQAYEKYMESIKRSGDIQRRFDNERK